MEGRYRSKNVDVDRFGKPSIPRTRRKRKRGPGGEISMPTTKEINDGIKKRIDDGTYNIGELITPKEFSMTMKADGTFTRETFCILGRKIPLRDIRQKLLQTQEDHQLLRATEN